MLLYLIPRTSIVKYDIIFKTNISITNYIFETFKIISNFNLIIIYKKSKNIFVCNYSDIIIYYYDS